MKQNLPSTPLTGRASQRANKVIEMLLKEMQLGIKQPDILESTKWNQLFGSEQPITAHLQKLVQVLAALPGMDKGETPAAGSVTQEALNDLELEQLTAWLQEAKLVAPNESCGEAESF